MWVIGATLKRQAMPDEPQTQAEIAYNLLLWIFLEAGFCIFSHLPVY